MLSTSKSFIGTNCPDLILVTVLAGIGGSADDTTMACPEIAETTAETLAGAVLRNMGLTWAAMLAAVGTVGNEPLMANVGMLAKDMAGGSTPRAVKKDRGAESDACGKDLSGRPPGPACCL